MYVIHKCFYKCANLKKNVQQAHTQHSARKMKKKVFIARGLIRNACYSSIFANI